MNVSRIYIVIGCSRADIRWMILDMVRIESESEQLKK